MSRHPYTYSADFIRSLAGHNFGTKGTVLSRSAAASIRQGIATAIGMDDAELAKRLSVYFQAHEAEINRQMEISAIATQTIEPVEHPWDHNGGN